MAHPSGPGSPRLPMVREAVGIIEAIRAGDHVGPINPDILETGLTFVVDYADQIKMAEWDAASRRKSGRESHCPDHYDPSDPKWRPGSGAAQRDGYDGTQMPGIDYVD